MRVAFTAIVMPAVTPTLSAQGTVGSKVIAPELGYFFSDIVQLDRAKG